ncbi:MAG: hypothetical protein OXG17_04150 [Chloroflexi bacterium]|nr:hypothetical protein [Chloroflexota bacterium]
MTRDETLAALVARAAEPHADGAIETLQALVEPLEIRSAWHRAGRPPTHAGEYRLRLRHVRPEVWWVAPLDAVPMQPGQFVVSHSSFDGWVLQAGPSGFAPEELFVDGDVADACRIAGAALLEGMNVDYVDLLSTGGGGVDTH